MTKLTTKERRLVRLFLGLLGFVAWGYCLISGVVAYLANHSLAGLALAMAGAGMLVVQARAMRNPNWPQRLW